MDASSKVSWRDSIDDSKRQPCRQNKYTAIVDVMTTALQKVILGVTVEKEPAFITAIRARKNAARVARYSRSDTYVNDQIIRFIQRNCPRGDGSITDATACIGGDAIPFTRRFRHVLCIEKDPHQFEQLVLNFSKTNLQAGVDYHCVHADALHEVPRRRHNIIYVDAPWGGWTISNGAMIRCTYT